MFLDYYAILEIDYRATPEEVKSAYRKQSLRWHPDKNSGVDTLKQMQLINESFLILKDQEARKLYDAEYLIFRSTIQYFEKSKLESTFYKYHDYSFKDEVLKKWMTNASIQADTLARQTITDFNRGIKAAGNEVVKSTVGFIIVGVIFFLIFALGRSCN